MAYDASTLTAVETAIAGLIAGTAVVSVTMNGRTIQYTRASLGELQKLKAEIETQLGTRKRTKFFRMTNKGL